MKPTIAYFSAEFSVADSLPIYAGGLGILAGDMVLEAGNEGRDFHAFGLVYHEAFTLGESSDTRSMVNRLQDEGFKLVMHKDDQPVIVPVEIGNRSVYVQAWEKQFGSARLVLFDSLVPGNAESDQRFTNRLYDSTPGVMLHQQLVLAFAAVKLMDQLEIEPDVYHLNEGHMAFVGIAVAVRHQRLNPELTLAQAITAIRPKIVATKHTILAGAGLTLDRENLNVELGSVLSQSKGTIDDLMALGGKPDGFFSTTKLLVSIANRQSGVSEIHVREEKTAHPQSKLMAITNGVFAPRWRAANLDPSQLDLAPEKLRNLHDMNRQTLLNYVAEQTGTKLDSDRLTVVWARRMTAYKRPEFLISDLARLSALIHHKTRPVQFIIAGTANPADAVGMDLISRIISASNNSVLKTGLAYVPHYNPMAARILVQGADVWLNTPIRGMEACGTSGMKASLNGAVQLSTSDGWVDEINLRSIGWELEEKAVPADLYDALEHEIAPLFYDNSDGWTEKMRANIELIEHQFTAKTMLKNYFEKLYT